MTKRATARVVPPPLDLARGLLALALSLCCVPSVIAATAGKVGGLVHATDSGEPMGFVQVVLLPADTTMRKVGGLTNADGSFLLEAAPGTYTLEVRALSYALKRIADVVVKAGELVTVNTALTPEAIQVKEVVVESRVRHDTDASLLAARKKATTVGDAVSAEQVRKTPDSNAAEVLRRVTGLSVSDDKYVFVRGLGERYSSTELDGVRLVSPEQNKRVVPLDMLPAKLLDHVTVQKTYTADRPGEFGGGDVQVQTRDFPGQRTWSLLIGAAAVDGLTFHDRTTYAGSPADAFGYGAGSRALPEEIGVTAGDRALIWSPGKPEFGFEKSTLAFLGQSFSNVWSPEKVHARPNFNSAMTYGDEFKLFHRSVGVISSWTFARSFSQRDEIQRLFRSETDTVYDYRAQRSVASAQLGGVMGLSYRLSPAHSIHLRGFYNNSADDEVRTYTGQDHNRIESTSGTYYYYRDARLMYVQRDLLSGTIEGEHEFPKLLNSKLDWRLGRSQASRLQPDRREVRYEERWYFPGDVAHWLLAAAGTRQFGELHDDGWGTTVNGSLPYRLMGLGQGRVTLGYDRQTKERVNTYRRFSIYHGTFVDTEAPAEQVFAPATFDSTINTAYVEETTDSLDNYKAHQRIEAGYLSVDVPLGHHGRANVGVRNERGYQDVQTTARYAPSQVTAEGKLDKSDWLPSANLSWSLSEAASLRLAASHTLSRPDLTELSPTRGQEEFYGGYMTAGNPNLNRATIDNYDVRVETFPGLSEVLAIGYFYKGLHDPIEHVLLANTGEGMILWPDNQAGGSNQGVEMEARLGLERAWKSLKGFSLNSNASIVRSKVRLKPMNAGSELGTTEHPLEGQAAYTGNVALGYVTPKNNVDMTLMLATTGRRLFALGVLPLPDIYEQAHTTLDAAANWRTRWHSRVKLAAKNLLDQEVRQLQGGRLASSYHTRRSFSIEFSWGY